jgi:hypothetical protein
MRGSTPLDVAASSVMDNNELALGLEEPDLEKVTGPWEHCIIFSCMKCMKPRRGKAGKLGYPSEPPPLGGIAVEMW